VGGCGNPDAALWMKRRSPSTPCRPAVSPIGEDDDGPGRAAAPKLRDTDQRFCSRLLSAGVTRTNALEAVVIWG